jgi:hypothetical protein
MNNLNKFQYDAPFAGVGICLFLNKTLRQMRQKICLDILYPEMRKRLYDRILNEENP